MRKVLEYIKGLISVQGVVTIAFVGTACYLYATGQEVPSSLLQLNGVALGFFFGDSTRRAIK